MKGERFSNSPFTRNGVFRLVRTLCPKLLLAATTLTVMSSCGDLAGNFRDPSAIRNSKPGSGSSAARFGMAAARGTALGLVRHPGTTARLGATVLWHRPRELFTGNFRAPVKFDFTAEQAPGTDGFEALLDGKKIPGPVSGKITWLVDGKRFFPEFERQIAAARQSIDAQVYIYDNDDVAVRYADLLKKRSDEVSVRVIFDDLGSSTAAASPPETPFPAGFTPPPRMGRYFRDGSSVKSGLMLNPWLVCDHTKLHVFDQKVALMGCMNIGREYYSEWHDLMFRVEGPAVARLQEDYNNTWRRANPFWLFSQFQKKPAVTPPASVAGAVPLRIIRTDPAAGRYEIHQAMLLGIRAARKRVWIEDPYIANDDITESLEDAAKRGVDVRLIYPDKNDSKIMDIANRAFATDLVKAGGKAFAYPGMTHLKVMICDDWACVGSANLDTLSMRINRELNIAVRASVPLNQLIEQVFRPDFAISKPHSELRAPLPVAPLAEAVADQL